ncbi:DNA-binding protein [Acaricomes phytoseiuli]|uniref:hypothetical protein n=1 Tax=Acaricomes phytoseiuli TaxID=291968 RepID=UPI00035D7A51|nr:hypothetical protein [Acaricomes phytoseiuli]MCW1248703.1 DNA-binding protein [Acaricomes phytoseiuli]
MTSTGSSLPEGAGLPRIGRPATDALTRAGYSGLDQLTGMTAKELLTLHGVGPKAIRILRQALAQRGEYFADETPEETR